MLLEKLVGPSHRFEPSVPPSFDMDGLSGRVVEFSGWKQSACVSLTIPFIRECQKRDLLTAWIVPPSPQGLSLFFPPDFHKAGIDCSYLPIIRADSTVDGFSIAEKLIRSGGVALVILDLVGGKRVHVSTVGRIHTLCQKYGSLAICLTRNRPGHPSLDPMIFVHAHVSASYTKSGLFTVTATIQKEKTHTPGKQMIWNYEAPVGLR